MNTEEYYLDNLYPSGYENLNEEDKKQYDKDKAFIHSHLDEINAEFNKCTKDVSLEEQIKKFGKQGFFSAFLNICKDDYDEETIITKFVNNIYNNLEKDSWIDDNFDDFMTIMRNNHKSERECKDEQKVSRPIDFDDVLNLTYEFLEHIDNTDEFAVKFKRMYARGDIELSSESEGSTYIDESEKIIYAFDGTLDSANTLLHEFIHYIIYNKADVTINRGSFSMLNEYLSIYYENAFIDFMDQKGILQDNENEQLKNSRLKKQFDKTPTDDFLVLLELCSDLNKGKTLDLDCINSRLQQTYPERSDNLQNFAKYCNDIFFSSEYVGLIMYKFCTALANSTPTDEHTIENLHKLAPYISDRQHDHIFMEKLEELLPNGLINTSPESKISQNENYHNNILSYLDKIQYEDLNSINKMIKNQMSKDDERNK